MYIGNKRVLGVFQTIYEDTPTQEKSLEISKNGEYEVTPDDKMALSKVNVNVDIPAIPTQEKTLEITENGTTEITADEGYTLSKVTANVNVSASGGNKIAQIADRTITELTAEDLKGATQIGSYAFRDCYSLTTVIIPESVTSIGASTFTFCEKLENVVIPESVTSIGASTFSDCRKLENITLPSGITVISKTLFNNAGLTSIIIPNNVTTIGGSAFARTKLTTVTIPNSVKSMSDSWIFQSCSKLISVRIGNGISSISVSTFQSCSALTDIYIDKAEGEVTGAPWGATNATIHWNTPLPSEEV